MAKKKIDIISNKFNEIESMNKFRTYLGKKVISKSGNKVGKIIDILAKGNIMVGVIVKGSKILFVDKEYFGADSPDAIMLSIDPVIMLEGKLVYDSKGRKLGKVIDLQRASNSNNYKFLVVKKNIYTKAFLIPVEDVGVSKENIMLNKSYD